MSAREYWREKASPVITLLLTFVFIGAMVGFAARANGWAEYPPSIGRAAGIPFATIVFNVEQP